MLAEAISKLEKLIHDGIQLFPATQEIDGHVYAPRPVYLVPEVVTKYPAPFAIHTLAGVVDYLRENRDQLELEQLVVHVESPTVVRVVDRIEGDVTRFRTSYVVANAEVVGATARGPQFEFGAYHRPDTFLIGLLALFVPTPERDELVRVIGNLQGDQVQQATDDGVSQQVTVRSGVSLVAHKVVRPIQVLRPYRTFREVEQPESPFLLRIQRIEGDVNLPKVALFEADAGTWRLEAIEGVAGFLRKGLEIAKLDAVAVLA